MTSHSIFQQTTFLLSVAKLSQLPPDQGAEVAFAGRSNAGKSSALNAITGIKNIARTSKTPGCTQLLNFFAVDEKRRLVDLPGYGYAKVPEEVKLRWQKTLGEYLTLRQTLRGLVLVTDIRHPLNPFDNQMLNWSRQQQLPVHLLLTKADKLSRGAAHATLQQVQNALQEFDLLPTVQLFSAKSGLGIQEARSKIGWLLSTARPNEHFLNDR